MRQRTHQGVQIVTIMHCAVGPEVAVLLAMRIWLLREAAVATVCRRCCYGHTRIKNHSSPGGLGHLRVSASPRLLACSFVSSFRLLACAFVDTLRPPTYLTPTSDHTGPEPARTKRMEISLGEAITMTARNSRTPEFRVRRRQRAHLRPGQRARHRLASALRARGVRRGDRLATCKMPAEFRFADALPVNASGKILKRGAADPGLRQEAP